MAKKIKYNGKEYSSESELARVYGIKITTFSYRLKEGWTIDEALGVVKRQHGRSVPIRYGGKEYSSKSELARAYGTNIKTFSYRLKKGWTIDEALGVVKRQHGNGKLIRYDGKEYLSKSELARVYGINITTFSSRLKKGWTIDEALGVVENPQHGRSIPIRYGGKEYVSRAELARVYGINIMTFSYRLKKGWTMDEALGVAKRQSAQQSTENVEDSPAGEEIVDEDEECETDLSLQMM